MVKSLLTAFCLLFITVLASYGRTDREIDSLTRIIKKAKTDAERVYAMNDLANYYYKNKSYKQGDSIISRQLLLAELSNDNKLILKTYFDNLFTSISPWSTKENFQATIKFIENGINFARSINEHDYVAIGYTRMAGLLRKKGDGAKAVEIATLALTDVHNVDNDSLKALVYIELGECYLQKGEAVAACKNYNTAYDLAVRSRRPYLQSDIDHKLADLYYSLGDLPDAKEHLLKSVKLNKMSKYGEGLIRDYTELARVTDNPEYIKMVFKLADSLKVQNKIIRAKNILLAIYMTIEKDSEKAIAYLNSEPDLVAFFNKDGIENYHFQIGEIYRYANNPDSALHYFKLAEPAIVANFDKSISKYIFLEMAACYRMKNDRDNAILYYEKMLEYCRSSDLYYTSVISDSLSILYGTSSDFEKAYNYKVLATKSKDSLQALSKESDIALLGVTREKAEHEEQLRQHAEQLANKRDLQYMAITIAISVIFIFFLVIGMFPVSKVFIKVFGYFSFISLFEFIVLVLDNTILHDITHGEPLKLWLIKIGLIALLVPVQHGLEHRLIHFLESRKLLEARMKFSLKNFMKKKPASNNELRIEEDAAVL